jgi:FKBP-type peptidyl-prolyl cis-trans isomerase FklB
MNAHRLVGMVLLAVAPLATAQEGELKTSKQKVSYGFGLNMGRSMLRDGVVRDDLDFALLVQGLRDALEDKPLKLTEKEFNEAFEAVILPKLVERAKARNAAYLVENKKKKGVKTTASGLQYRVLKSGDGKTPKPGDAVRADYRGKLIDGAVFDQSEQPVEFKVKEVIKGWAEALQLMKEGDQFELVVPAELAYGDAGFPPGKDEKLIPPHSTLVFEIELIAVVPATTVPRNTTRPKSEAPR